MIQILVLEDNADKAQRIREALLGISQIADSSIQVSSDLIGGKRALQQKQFDLLVLDIQIPNRFDQQPLRDGGIKFLEELETSERLYLPSHIIGLTEFDDLLADAGDEFHRRLWSIVKYERNST